MKGILDILIGRLHELQDLSKDKWSITLEREGGFIRNKFNPDKDRYFVDIDQCFEYLDTEIGRFKK